MFQQAVAVAAGFVRWLTNPNHRRQVAMLLFAAALVVRFAGLAVSPQAHLSTNAKNSIIRGAELIRQGEFVNNPDYPMLVPPLTALFTAGVQLVFGTSLFPVKVVQIVVDSLTVVLVFGAACMMLPYASAAIGSLLLVVYPFAVFTPLYIGTEVLFTFFLVASLFALLAGIKKGQHWCFLVSGVLLGLATLTRGTTLFLPVFLAAFLAWYARADSARRSNVAMQIVALTAGFLLVLGPWTARNYVVHHAFIPASTSSGPLLHGSSEEFWLIADRERELPRYYRFLAEEKGITASPNPSWVEKDHYYRRAAVEKYYQRWREDPWSFVPFFVKKAARLWYATESGANQMVVLVINLPFYVFALIGIWFLFKDRARLAQLSVVVLAYFAALHVAVFAYFRYVVPIMPLVLLLAAHGGVHMAANWRHPKTDK